MKPTPHQRHTELVTCYPQRQPVLRMCFCCGDLFWPPFPRIVRECLGLHSRAGPCRPAVQCFSCGACCLGASGVTLLCSHISLTFAQLPGKSSWGGCQGGSPRSITTKGLAQHFRETVTCSPTNAVLLPAVKILVIHDPVGCMYMPLCGVSGQQFHLDQRASINPEAAAMPRATDAHQWLH